jgi:hypothetical protein
MENLAAGVAAAVCLIGGLSFVTASHLTSCWSALCWRNRPPPRRKRSTLLTLPFQAACRTHSPDRARGGSVSQQISKRLSCSPASAQPNGGRVRFASKLAVSLLRGAISSNLSRAVSAVRLELQSGRTANAYVAVVVFGEARFPAGDERI